MRVVIYISLLIVATVLALLRGTAGEKWTVSVLFVGNAVTFGLVKTVAGSFATVSLGYFAIDAVVALLLCSVAVTYPSWATILVSAFQLNGTLGHIVKLLAPDIIPFSYSFLLRVWAWPMVIVLLMARISPHLVSILKAKGWPHIFVKAA